MVNCGALFCYFSFFRFYLVSKLMEDEKLFYCYKFTEILEPMNFFIKNKLKFGRCTNLHGYSLETVDKPLNRTRVRFSDRSICSDGVTEP